MFGINAQEFLVLLAVAAVVLGPERLPQYAQQLGNLVRQLRRMALGAQEQVRNELGPEFDDVDWRKLDPRQYDPRRIVREALSDTFDPDDPLGLKDDAPGKPVSRGGPRDVDEALGAGLDEVEGRGRGEPDAGQEPRPRRTGATAAPAKVVDDDVPLDPDAT